MNRQDLIDYRKNVGLIEDMKELLKTKRKSVNKTTSSYTQTSVKGSSDVQDKEAERLTEILDEEEERIDEEYYQKVTKVEKMVYRMKNVLYKRILIQKYLLGYKTELIAKNLDNMDPKYISNQLSKALKAFDNLCKEYSPDKNNNKIITTAPCINPPILMENAIIPNATPSSKIPPPQKEI